jgi:hypothetical protein
MRRVVKVKTNAALIPLRKAVTTASAAARRGFPAWIEADDGPVALSVKAAAMPRIRDALVLRKVSRKKISSAKGSRHGDSPR